MEIFSLFINDFTVLDCAIMHPQRGPIGMSWLVDVKFIGQQTAEGVVFDFSYAKKTAKAVIDSTADHAFIAPNYLFEAKQNEKGWVHDSLHSETFHYTAPEQAFFVLNQVTTSAITNKLEELIMAKCKEHKDCGNLIGVELTLKEETVPGSYFNYTHGLKQHYGNCQRLIHGHRSLVKVYVNGVRDAYQEKKLADMYCDKHLVYNQNIVLDTYKSIHIGYTSSQGEFNCTFRPESVIYYPFETTIENISKFMAYQIKYETGNLVYSSVEVYAYEGINKGCSYILPAGIGTHLHYQNLWPNPTVKPEVQQLLKG